MISQNEIKEVLIDNKFSKDEIDVFLCNISENFLRKATKNKINNILVFVRKYNLNVKLTKSFLIYNDALEMESIYIILIEKKISKKLIEKCLSILFFGKAEEIEKIFVLFEKQAISKVTIEKCLYVLARGKAKEIEKIFIILEEKGISKETIEKCLYVLACGKAEEIKKIFILLEDKGISKVTIEKCLYVLACGKSEEIEKIFLLLEKKGISKETVENCLSVLARGKAEEIEKIFLLLEKKEISKDTIENCLSVLTLGKSEEINKIFILLEDKGINKETIENCLSLLARGKAEEIEKIFILLEEKGIRQETIEKCLSVLAYGKVEEIEKIFILLEKKGISKETIEKYLYLLACGKAEEINKIFILLEEKGIAKAIVEKCLCVLARNKAEEIRKIFILLEEKEIIKKNINRYFKEIISCENVLNIFQSSNAYYILLYCKLKGYYNILLNEKDTSILCRERNITLTELIIAFNGDVYINDIVNTFNTTGKLYLGGNCKIDTNYLNDNYEIFFEISKKISKRISSLTGLYDLSEIEDMVLEFIIFNCGGIVFNFISNKKLMINIICKFTGKSIYYKLLKEINNEKKVNSIIIEEDMTYTLDEPDCVDLSDWDVDDMEKKILNDMADLLTQGYQMEDIIAMLALNYNVSEDDINTVIQNIRNNNQKLNRSKK